MKVGFNHQLVGFREAYKITAAQFCVSVIERPKTINS